MTYSNALLPCAVIAGGCIAGDKEAVKTGVEALDFLSSVILSDGTLKLIGCNGWYPRGGKKAVFDEQPIDAMFSVLAYCEAYRRLGDIKYKELARSAFEWFLGRNNFGKAMYDPHTGACYDGLSQYGPNLNQGAESSLAYVIAQLSFIETFGTTAICNAGGA